MGASEDISTLDSYYYIKLKIIDNNNETITYSSGTNFAVLYDEITALNKPNVEFNEAKSAVKIS